MPLKMFQEKPQNEIPHVRNIVAIAAGKGGVGKSSVTVNLARALQSLGYSVGVMDTDLYGPSVRKMMPETRLPAQKGSTIIPALCNGIKMISMAYFRKESEASVMRAPIANGIINQFAHQVEWGDLDFLLVDFPPGTGDIQLTLTQQLQLKGAIMVTLPQEVSVLDVRKAMHLFEQVHVPILGIVENMSYYPHPQTKEPLYLFGNGGGSCLARETGVPFLGEIPIDPLLSQSGDTGQSIFEEDHPEAQGCVEVFLRLASRVVMHLEGVEREFVPAHFELIWQEMPFSHQGPPILQDKEKFLAEGTALSPGVQKIFQQDNFTLAIAWEDGTVKSYRLSELQKSCPCAGCVDESTGKRTTSSNQVQPDVRAVKIASVGRYGLRIQFTSGCSSGIYGFDVLQKMGGVFE